ncbi:MAG: hypothetical protein AAF456_21575 [Planctomycetota bacterium]
MNTYVKSCAALLVALASGLGPFVPASSAQEAASRVGQAIDAAIHFHHESRHMPRQVDAIRKKHELYFSMASRMDLQGELEHLSVPDNSSFASVAARVESGLKPGICYEVVKSRGSANICGSDEISDRLERNLRYITWYRGQLDQSFDSDRTDKAAKAVAGLIDEFLSRLADSVPRVRIRMSGDLVNDGEQKLEFSDAEIWGILSSLNRYFFYKFQLNPGRSDFQDADFMLIESMVKTAAIYGSRPPSTGLQEIEFELTERDRGWQKHAFDALETWKDYEEAESNSICVITIPDKPSPEPEPEAPPEEKPEFPSDVEDIKEIGDQIFIKRSGRWEPWSG